MTELNTSFKITNGSIDYSDWDRLDISSLANSQKLVMKFTTPPTLNLETFNKLIEVINEGVNREGNGEVSSKLNKNITLELFVETNPSLVDEVLLEIREVKSEI